MPVKLGDTTPQNIYKKINIEYYTLVLGLPTRITNMIVYSELGTYPLYVNRHAQIIQYWLKLSKQKIVF